MNPTLAFISLFMLLSIPDVKAQEELEKIDIEVSAQANLYFSQVRDTSIIPGGAGIPPVVIDIRGVKMITFENAEGTVTCFNEREGTYFGADGGAYGEKTDVQELGGLSGIKHNKKVMFLTGVIISDYSLLEPPFPAIDYTEKENYEELYPSFDQPFFIGDGKNKDGATQRILVRREATTLIVGFADCLIGPARNYRNNDGTIKITVVLHRTKS
ncbi:MAG: hypothetical protein H6550_00495 [Chitinophagales bacterium]|nr:hypothetical protein [Chitinophagales bacterium]